LTEYPRKTFSNLFWVGLATGLAASTKWTGFYVVGMAFVWGVGYLLKKRNWKMVLISILCLGFIPVVVYILSYTQWWLQGHTVQQFVELHQQIWWYQTGLKATHAYQSQALTWPFLYKPVWFYVSYKDVIEPNGEKQLYIGNIYTMGSPIIWWVGLLAILYAIIYTLLHWWRKLRKRVDGVRLLPFCLLFVGYFGMFLPWALSPRIMFLYHYLPSIPFLCLILAYGLYSIRRQGSWGRYVVSAYLSLVVLVFIYFYPHWSALPLPQAWVNSYYWLPSWK
jgi:dolichyl-phosphate-mannose--protein O-mannosyl transferase